MQKIKSYFIFCTLVLAGCPTMKPQSGCEPHTTRCNGEIAELCSPTGRWREIANCSTVTSSDDVERHWTCGQGATGDHSCIQSDAGAR